MHSYLDCHGICGCPKPIVGSISDQKGSAGLFSHDVQSARAGRQYISRLDSRSIAPMFASAGVEASQGIGEARGKLWRLMLDS